MIRDKPVFRGAGTGRGARTTKPRGQRREVSDIMGMPSTIKRFLSVFVLVSLPVLSMAVGQDAPPAGSDAAPTIDEARAAWKEIYNKYLEGFTASIDTRIRCEFPTSKQVQEESLREEVSLKGNLLWSRHFDQIPERPNTLSCGNDKYTFLLEEDGTSHSYRLKETEVKDSAGDEERLDYVEIFNGIRLGGIAWLEKVVTDPTFQILSAKYIDDPDSGRRLAEFTFKSEYLVGDAERMTGGRIVLIPEYYWMVKEYQFDAEEVDSAVEEKYNYKSTITYQMIEGIPFPEEIFLTTVLPDGTPFGITRTDKVTKVTRQPLPKKQFYLRYYGFGAPAEVTRGRWYKIAAIAAACFLIAAGIYLRRRRAGRQTA